MDFGDLNKIARSSFLPRKKWDDLEENTEYHVTKIRQVTTRFGVRAVVELNDSFQTFLPNRINNAMEKDEHLFERLRNSVETNSLVIKYFSKGFFEFNSK